MLGCLTEEVARWMIVSEKRLPLVKLMCSSCAACRPSSTCHTYFKAWIFSSWRIVCSVVLTRCMSSCRRWARRLDDVLCTAEQVRDHQDASIETDEAAMVAQHVQMSTFSTPPGITPDNFNSKVVCAPAAETAPATTRPAAAAAAG